MKKINRTDERKLFEAYMVLDKICNKSNPKKEIIQETLEQVFSEFENIISHFVFEIYSLKREAKFHELSRLQFKLNEIFEELKNKYLEAED